MESNLCFKENLIHCSTAGCKRLSTSTSTLKQGLLKLLTLYKIRYEVYLFTFSLAFFFSSWKCKAVWHLSFTLSSPRLSLKSPQIHFGQMCDLQGDPRDDCAAVKAMRSFHFHRLKRKPPCDPPRFRRWSKDWVRARPPVLDCLRLTAELLSMQQVAAGWGVNSRLDGLQNHLGMLRARSNWNHKTSAAFNSGAWHWRTVEGWRQSLSTSLLCSHEGLRL